MRRFSEIFNSISIRILLSYLSILLIPLLAIGIIYNTAIQALLDTQQKETIYSLEQTARIMQQRLEELNNIISYIQTAPSVNSIANSRYAQNSFRNIAMIKNSINSFPSYQLTNQMIDSVFIFFTEASYIAKLPNGFPFTKETYDSNVHFRGISYEALQKMCSNHHEASLMTTSDEYGSDILLLRSVTGSDTLIVIRLNPEYLRDILRTNYTNPGDGVYVIKDKDTLLAGVGSEDFSAGELTSYAEPSAPFYREILKDGRAYLIYIYRYGGLTYFSLQEKDDFLRSISSIKYVMLLFGAAAFLAGTLLCVALWKRRSDIVKSMEATARRLGVPISSMKSEQVLLETTVNTLADTVGTLREALTHQKEALNQTTIQNLLHGAIPSREELQIILTSTGPSLTAKFFNVVNVVLLNPSETGMEYVKLLPYRIFLKDFLQKNLNCEYIVSDMDSGSFVLLFQGEDDIPVSKWKKLFGDISYRIEQKDWIAPTFIISDSCGDPWELDKLYGQTIEIQEYLTCMEMSGVYTMKDLPQSTDLLHFPVGDEIRLRQILKSGNREELESFWLELITENITRRILNATMLMELRETLRHSILRTLAESISESEVNAIISMTRITKSIEGLYQCAEQALYVLTKATGRQNAQQMIRLKESLQLSIEKNLSNPAFSLYMLSEEVGIPESTLYRNFKGHFGVSFTIYLEQRRINKAFELLREQVPVKDVACKVGYTSDHTFRRAFKRIMKVPPSQFLES